MASAATGWDPAPAWVAGEAAVAGPPNGRRGRPAGCCGHRGCGAWRDRNRWPPAWSGLRVSGVQTW